MPFYDHLFPYGWNSYIQYSSLPFDYIRKTRKKFCNSHVQRVNTMIDQPSVQVNIHTKIISVFLIRNPASDTSFGVRPASMMAVTVLIPRR